MLAILEAGFLVKLQTPLLRLVSHYGVGLLALRHHIDNSDSGVTRELYSTQRLQLAPLSLRDPPVHACAPSRDGNRPTSARILFLPRKYCLHC